MADDPISREWILAELRGLRELADRERVHVIQRFDEVNKLRDQVLEERGVFVRHEALTGLIERIGRLEQRTIDRIDHERALARLGELERVMIPRVDLDGVARRVGKLESFGPLIAVLAALAGAVIARVFDRALGL